MRDGDARALLSSAVRFKLVEQVPDRILAEARGNPLAPNGAGSWLQRHRTCGIRHRGRFNGAHWVLGFEARARALVADPADAEALYRRAIERLGRTRFRAELARAHLVYGEWLRREHRRVDARAQLRAAHDLLTSIGIEAFAERARRELLATGETVRKRTVETLEELTAQEVQVARLAADGKTNPEIGAQLFLSPRWSGT